MITKETNIAFFFLLLSLILRGLKHALFNNVYSMGWRKGIDAQWLEIQGVLGGFGQILLRGVLAVVRKCRRVPFLYFIAFLCDKFLELTPSLPLPPPPVCIFEKRFIEDQTLVYSFCLFLYLFIFLFFYFFYFKYGRMQFYCCTFSKNVILV